MMRFPVSGVFRSGATPDGSEVQIEMAWLDGEKFILALPTDVAAQLVVAAQDAASDAERAGGRDPRPLIADRVAVQASNLPGRVTLTIQSEGGLNLHFSVPDLPFEDHRNR